MSPNSPYETCLCSGSVVGVPSWNPAEGRFFLNKKEKFVFLELDGGLS